MISARRKPFTIGRSKGITLPGSMRISTEVSMAASDRLILMDTTGEIPEHKLVQFFIDHVEPAFSKWAESQKPAAPPSGGMQTLQEKPQAVMPAKPLKVEGVATPQPDVPVVSCFRCSQLIAWTLDPGATAVCPRCGAVLRLVAYPGGKNE